MLRNLLEIKSISSLAELCRLLNINRAQLPERLELEPGEEVPEEFAILEARPNAAGQYEVENPSPSGDAPATEDNTKLLPELDDGDESAN